MSSESDFSLRSPSFKVGGSSSNNQDCLPSKRILPDYNKEKKIFITCTKVVHFAHERSKYFNLVKDMYSLSLSLDLSGGKLLAAARECQCHLHNSLICRGVESSKMDNKQLLTRLGQSMLVSRLCSLGYHADCTGRTYIPESGPIHGTGNLSSVPCS